MAVEADPDGNALWIADTYNSCIKRLDLETRQVTTVKFSHTLNEPCGMALFRNKLYIANTNAHEIVSLDLQTQAAEVVEIKEPVAEF
jgi:DNA-binding beta-propeller fold protein YncE